MTRRNPGSHRDTSGRPIQTPKNRGEDERGQGNPVPSPQFPSRTRSYERTRTRERERESDVPTDTLTLRRKSQGAEQLYIREEWTRWALPGSRSQRRRAGSWFVRRAAIRRALVCIHREGGGGRLIASLPTLHAASFHQDARTAAGGGRRSAWSL